MTKKKKRATKNRKKFWIIISCYIAIFVITSITTLATLSWFNSSTWQSDVLYMGGPVYLFFSDASGTKQTSGDEKLVLETPENWDELYPGMNIRLEAQAVLQGHSWTHTEPWGEETVVVTTGAILRAKVMVEVTDPEGNTDSLICKQLYDGIWPQLKTNALKDNSNEGMWVFDQIDTEVPENNFFYYVNKGQSVSETGDYLLTEIGGTTSNQAVGFLNGAIVTLSGLSFGNEHADCKVKFTIVFHALQAFLPYEYDEVGVADFQGELTGGRSDKVLESDVGLAKPLTIANSRDVFTEALAPLYPDSDSPEPTL